ncbi:MAG: four helix bundle protein [Polyangiaceae bacterium]
MAVERAYDLWLWLDARVTDFPAHARHGVGHAILGASIDLMTSLLRATYTPREDPRAREALAASNGHLALLRLLLRGARERRYLAIGQHEHAVERLAELGRMVGGWWKRTTSLQTGLRDA